MTKAELYKKACMLPLLPGVYIIRDKSGTIIYIGKAKRLRIRVSQYFREGVPHDNKVSQMIAHAYAFDVIVCQSEFEALVLEASQIKAHTPKYNILLKDDKGYSYIKVTKDEWPRLSFTLQKEDDGAEYIGPYTSSFAARQMAETAMDAFLLPRCSRRFPQEIGRGRPCLNAHIGKCMAVCSGKISCENYEQAVKNAVHLIRYGKKDILKTLNERMLEASDRLEFETAALLRDQINAITKVTAGQKVVVDPEVEMDVVALAGTPSSVCAAVLRFREGRLTDKREFLFHDTADIAAVREEFLPRYYLDDEQIPKIIAVDELPPDSEVLQQALNEKRGSEVQLYVPQRGDKAHLVEMAHTNAVERLARESGRYAREEKLLDELAQVLGLPKPPRAIESYDISNWGDGSSVCGMVTFKDGKPFKAGYRKFKMKTVAGTDDYASLAETVSRRAAEYEKYVQLAQNGEPSSNWFGQKPDLLLMDGGSAQDLTSASNDNSVKISTIHNSKGLEYPVVFVASLGRDSITENTMDKSERAFVDKNLLAINYRDSFEMQSYGTIPNYIGKLRKRHLELSEVMRLFYVACTRAREKLVLIGCRDRILDIAENKEIYQNKNGKFIPTLMQAQNNIMKWLSYTVMECKEDYIDIENVYVPNMRDYLIKDEEVSKLDENSISNVVLPENISENDEYINIAKKLDWVYPNEFASQIPTNMSITEIKRRHTAEIVENGDAEKIASSFKEQNAVYPMPKFLKENTDKISAAQLGSVYHAILEKLDFLSVSTEDEVKNSVDSFVKKGFLSVKEVEAVDLKKIVAFLNSPLGQRIKKLPAENIHKESTFIMYMTPDEVAQLNGTLPEEFWGSNYKKVEDRILINGIIDLYFKDGDDYVLVDYKTDNVESMEELVERYEVQLKFYKKALEMNYNIEISELVIYSLKLNSQIIL